LVSAIIPARNEETSIARAVESVAAQPEVDELIVVDDASGDRTGEILRTLALRIPKLKILQTHEVPAGWTGKNYALSVGAAAAHGDWLLFTDADTCHLPRSTARALADSAEHSAVLVSYSPEQEMGSVWERALIPYVMCRLAGKYSYARVNDPGLPDAAANGQFLLVRRDVYESVGGHAAVAPQILEDVALAEIVKNAGHAIYFAAPAGVVRTRMYRSFKAMWEGWTKNLYLLFPDDSDAAEKWMVYLSFAFVFGMLLWVPSAKAHLTLLLYSAMAASLCAWHIRYLFLLRKNHFPLKNIRYLFAGAWLFMVIRAVSWWKNTHGSVSWKGRTYPARSL
jgi:glycosyltransferase involved in cell wall biosynthesis